MNYNFDYKVLEKAILNYGTLSQKIMLFEEMAELQKEVCKELRGNGNRIEVASEMADVYIMFEQLKMMCDIDEKDVQGIINFKIDRLNNRLDSEQE